MKRTILVGLVLALTVLVPASAQVVDATPPVIECGSADGTWHAADVSVACTAEDAESGIPNPDDQAFNLTTSVLAGTETANASTGTRQVCNGAADPLCASAGPILGNRVDKKAPTVDCASASGAWRRTDASVPCTAEDGGSGLANPAQANFSLMTNVPNGTEPSNALTDSQQVCDNVGRCKQAGPIGGNRIDKKRPRNPSRIRSSDHRVRKWSRDRRVTMRFNAGRDGGSRVDGFSFSWTRRASSVPDTRKDREQAARAVTSRRLNGRWYFHLRTRDRVGNWSAPAHRGPYLIDGRRPRVRALSASGKVNKSLRLRYRTADNNNRTRERITVARSGSTVASWRRGMARAVWWNVQSVSWTPRSAGTYSFCVAARDVAGNARRDCARVRVRKPAPPPPPQPQCDPSYPGVCIPPPPPDLDCAEVPYRNFKVRQPDPHGFDGDFDGVGCET